MKKIICFLLLALAMASCEKEVVTTFKIDPLATINIRPSTGVKLRGLRMMASDTIHLTALEIVKQTNSLIFIGADGGKWIRGFDPLQRDTLVPMLKMWATDVLYYEQNIDGSYITTLLLSPEFIEAKNCLLINIKGDTLAYIPNSVLRLAETRIKTFFTEMKYDSIYPIFNNAYTFIPITGGEYRALNQ